VAQSKLNAIGDALFQAYIFQPFQIPEEYELQQQEEQQQQTFHCGPFRPARPA
jgi:hypothetical protein